MICWVFLFVLHHLHFHLIRYLWLLLNKYRKKCDVTPNSIETSSYFVFFFLWYMLFVCFWCYFNGSLLQPLLRLPTHRICDCSYILFMQSIGKMGDAYDFEYNSTGRDLNNMTVKLLQRVERKRETQKQTHIILMLIQKCSSMYACICVWI